MEIQPSRLDDPLYAAFARARYWRLMRWMTAGSVIVTIVATALLLQMTQGMSWLTIAFSSGGIFFTLWLAAALMGLVFLSSGSGHDEAVADPLAEEQNG